MSCSAAAGLGALASTPLVVLAVHAVLSRRLGRVLAPQPVAGLSALCAAVPVGGLLAAGGLRGGGAWLYALVVYGALAYAYLHLFNLSETARRLRILLALEARGEASFEELEARYGGPGAVLAVRMERLEAMGSAVKVNGRWFLRHRSLAWTAALVAAWRRVLFG